jgi:hypothetical protein
MSGDREATRRERPSKSGELTPREALVGADGSPSLAEATATADGLPDALA